MKKIFVILILVGIIVPNICYAEDKIQNTVTVDEQTINKKVPSYNANLKRLVQEAEKNIKKINGELKKRGEIESK